MADAINAAILSAVEDGPQPIGLTYQTLLPVAGRDLLLRGGTFMKSAWPTIANAFTDPPAGLNFELVTPRDALLTGRISQKFYRANNITVSVSGEKHATFALLKLVGGTWSTVTLPVAAQVRDVHFGAGVWLLCTTAGLMKSTDNLATVTLVSAPPVSGGLLAVASIYDAGTWLVVLAKASESSLALSYFGEMHFTRSTDNFATWSAAALLYADNSHNAGNYGTSVIQGPFVHIVKAANRFYLIYGAHVYDSVGESAGETGYIKVWPVGMALTSIASDNGTPVAGRAAGQVLVDEQENIHIIDRGYKTAVSTRYTIPAGGTAITMTNAVLNIGAAVETWGVINHVTQVKGRFLHVRGGSRMGAVEGGNPSVVNTQAYLIAPTGFTISGAGIGADGFLITGNHAAGAVMNQIVDRYSVHYAPYFIVPDMAPNAIGPYYMRAR